MITNIDSISSALDTIQTEDDTYPSCFSNKMDANDFNESCRIIEQQLNELYEKIRLIEEVDSFCRDYVKKEIETKESKLRESLKIIEDAVDLYQQPNSTSVLVPFNSNGQVVRDRDGCELSNMVLRNGKLEAGNDALADATISAVTYSSNTACYSNSYGNLPDGKAGCSFYSVSRPVDGGVKESVKVVLREPSTCNYLSVQPSNCVIDNVTITDSSHNKHEIGNANGYFDEMSVLEVDFDLTCKQYTIESKSVDVNGYDQSCSFGMIDSAYSREEDDTTIKQMERSQAEADKKYIVNSLKSFCEVQDQKNKKLRRKNILLAEEDA